MPGAARPRAVSRRVPCTPSRRSSVSTADGRRRSRKDAARTAHSPPRSERARERRCTHWQNYTGCAARWQPPRMPIAWRANMAGQPHPGLALLRLAQGQHAAARATIDRVMAEPARGGQRASVLVAAVEIFLRIARCAAGTPGGRRVGDHCGRDRLRVAPRDGGADRWRRAPCRPPAARGAGASEAGVGDLAGSRRTVRSRTRDHAGRPRLPCARRRSMAHGWSGRLRRACFANSAQARLSQKSRRCSLNNQRRYGHRQPEG